MSLLNLKKFGVLAAVVGLFSVVLVQGCSSDDTQATPGTGGKQNTAGTGGKESGGETSKAGSGNNGGSAGEPDGENGGASGDGEGGAAGEAAVDPSCIGDDGCYSCEPKTNIQFLNGCVEGGCPATFDNSKLTKLNLVGTL